MVTNDDFFLLLRMHLKNITKCPVLRGLKQDEVKKIFADIHYNIQSYEKDNLILTAGETCKNLMILLEGEVRGEMIDYSGNTVKIEDIPAPKPIAPAFLFGENNKYPVSIISNKYTRILFIPKDEVLKLFQNNKVILENYLDIVSSRGQFLSDKVKLLSMKNLKQRIAYYLLKRKGTAFNNKMTQEELAKYLGVTRPALSRTLNRMEDEKIIRYSKGIEVLSEKRLYAILQNEV